MDSTVASQLLMKAGFTWETVRLVPGSIPTYWIWRNRDTNAFGHIEDDRVTIYVPEIDRHVTIKKF